MDDRPADQASSESRADAPLASSTKQPRPRSHWLKRMLMGIGAFVVCLIAVAIGGALLSRRAFREVKPAALQLANEFTACSLAEDRACVLRLSTWNEAVYDKGAPMLAAVRRKLGKRGVATLDEKTLRYRRNASVGANALRWSIQLQLQVAYERAPAVNERFLLEDRGQGLKVVRMDWHADALVLN